MTRRQSTYGACFFCQEEFSKGGIARHLKACPVRKEAIAQADGKKGSSQNLYHLKIQDAGLGSYWLYLEMRGKAHEFACDQCGAPAAYWCQECYYDHEQYGFLCDEHDESHEHTDYGEPMPVVNSPRTGKCAYVGPAEPPY